MSYLSLSIYIYIYTHSLIYLFIMHIHICIYIYIYIYIYNVLSSRAPHALAAARTFCSLTTCQEARRGTRIASFGWLSTFHKTTVLITVLVLVVSPALVLIPVGSGRSHSQ